MFRGRENAQEGGVSLRATDVNMWVILLIAAYIDFVHDFNDSGRAPVNATILNDDPYGVIPPLIKFRGIEKLMGDLRAPTAFHVFKDKVIASLLTQLPEDAPRLPLIDSLRRGEILHETDILDLIRVEYNRFISGLPQQVPQPAPGINPLTKITGSMGIPGALTVGATTYDVTSYPTKLRGENKAFVHTAEAFHAVTNKQRNVFVCMIDAASCSMDVLGDPWADHLSYLGQQYNSSLQYHFFILNSKENISDPAGKSTIRNKTLPLRVDPAQPNVFIYFLEEADPNHVSVFPAGTQDVTDPVEVKNQAAFTPFTVETRRTGSVETPLVSAIARGNAGTFTVNDVGTDSEVRSAVQRAVTQTLLGNPTEEVVLNFIMKRFGDWCQALCLRDTSRRYKVVKVNKASAATPGQILSENNVVSLDDLQNRYKALVFLLTIDRVLLAFALAMGLNVIFTSKSGVIGTSWMTLFQNAASGLGVSDAADLYNKLNVLDEMVKRQGAYVEGVVKSVPAILEPILTYRFDQYPEALIRLRDVLSELSFLPTLPTLILQLNKVTEGHEDDNVSFLIAFTKYVISQPGGGITIPIDISQIPQESQDEYRKAVNDFRSFVTTVEKNDALVKKNIERAAAVSAGTQPMYSPERMKEGKNLATFFEILSTRPELMSSRHPAFKSAEQTLRSIVSDAKLAGIPLPPLGDISSEWDRQHSAKPQFMPRLSSRGGVVFQPPMRELFAVYPTVAAGGGQRGGATTLIDIFEAPFTDMVYVTQAPAGRTAQFDDERMASLRQEAQQEAITQLTGQGVQIPDEATFNANGGPQLVDAILSQLIGAGAYKGYLTNGRGRYASVIDPYVFREDDDLTEYLSEDLSTKPRQHTMYVTLRYMLQRLDEVRADLSKLEDADPDNLAELDTYDRLDAEVDALLSIDIPKSEVGQDDFVRNVIEIMNGGLVEKSTTDLDKSLVSISIFDTAEFVKTFQVEDVGSVRAQIYMEFDSLPVWTTIKQVNALREQVSQQPALQPQYDAAAAAAQQQLNDAITFVGNIPNRPGMYTFMEDLVSFVAKSRFNAMLDGLYERYEEVRADIYDSYEKLGMYSLAYPQFAPPAGGIRRKTHRRRRLPKLI